MRNLLITWISVISHHQRQPLSSSDFWSAPLTLRSIAVIHSSLLFDTTASSSSSSRLYIHSTEKKKKTRPEPNRTDQPDWRRSSKIKQAFERLCRTILSADFFFGTLKINLINIVAFSAVCEALSEYKLVECVWVFLRFLRISVFRNWFFYAFFSHLLDGTLCRKQNSFRDANAMIVDDVAHQKIQKTKLIK